MAHRPGAGAIVAIVGLVLFMLSLFALPWISEGGEDVTLSDIGKALDAADDVATGPPTSADHKADYLQLYAQGLGIAVLVWLGAAVIFSTLVVPRSKGARAAVGFMLAGVVGLIANIADEGGKVGPRLSGALVTLIGGAAHAYALSIVFVDPEPAPDPTFGVWLGLIGLAAIMTGCLLGTRSRHLT